MISLDQVRLLEKKVETAVNKIVQLQKENAELREKCRLFETKTDNLAQRVSIFEADQSKIEQGILHVLEKLNIVEDTIREAPVPDSRIPQEPVIKTEDIQPKQALGGASVSEANASNVSLEQKEIEQSLFGQQDQTSVPSNGQFDIF